MRDGNWPAELKFLLERHPRSRWHDEATARVAFWLDVHAGLRRDCAELEAAGDDHRALDRTRSLIAAKPAPQTRSACPATICHIGRRGARR